jgi:DNA sulfur modification protein DndC
MRGGMDVARGRKPQLTFDFNHNPITWALINALVWAMRRVYLSDDRPWVIGFSGGKDSSAVVQLVIRMLMALSPDLRLKPVYILSSDTLVENPRVSAWLDKCHAELRQVAADHNLPLFVVKVTPDPKESFWANLIGKGLPAPSQWFRWCTGRLKIDPAEEYILTHIHPRGRILQLLGSRRAESKAREASIEKHALEGKFGKSGALPEGMTYMPIDDWDNDNVWEYLRGFETPWQRPNDAVMVLNQLTKQLEPNYNNELFELYQDAHAGECVMEWDRRTASCGGSRFGCWTCTVVPEDASMTNMVQGITPEYAPLLGFRQKIIDLRNDWSKRELHGRNGTLRFMATIPDPVTGLSLHGPIITPGPYILEVRAELLRDLLAIERALPGFKTVTDNDWYWIRYHWEHDYGAGDLLDRIRREAGEAAA